MFWGWLKRNIQGIKDNDDRTFEKLQDEIERVDDNLEYLFVVCFDTGCL